MYDTQSTSQPEMRFLEVLNLLNVDFAFDETVLIYSQAVQMPHGELRMKLNNVVKNRH
jgi:hypothetical protein